MQHVASSKAHVRGLFLVVEGIDGSGSTTQAARLADELRARGDAVHLTSEPSRGPIGRMIRDVLTGRWHTSEGSGAAAPSWRTMAALFAADRLHHLEAEVRPQLDRGATVVCDRYDYSTVAYQSQSGDDSPEAIGWLRELNAHADRPDLVIILDIDAASASIRRANRGQAEELYEMSALQEKLATFYDTIETWFPDDRIVHVDAKQSVDEVLRRILTEVDRCIQLRA